MLGSDGVHKIYKKSVKNLALLLFGLLVGLIIAEGVSRIIYTKPWHLKLLEEQNDRNLTSSVRKNSLGLRGKDYRVPKRPNCKRVLILGDSFTFGKGVADDAAVFPELLENQLNAEWVGQGLTAQILNGGISASLTDQWVELLLKVKDTFKPDVVLIVFFLRDGTYTGSMPHFFNPIRDELKTKDQDSFLYQYSYLFRLYRDSRDRAYLASKYSKALNDSYMGGAEQTREWQIAKANILKIKAVSEEVDARVGLVVFPVLVDLNDRYPFKEIYDVIVSFGVENHIPTHGLLPAFMGKNGPDLWVSAFDQHPNAAAHAIAANSILPFLRQLLKDS